MAERDDVVRRLYRVQQSTRTFFPVFRRLHNRLRQKNRAYYQWHLHPKASVIHSLILSFVIVLQGTLVLSTFPTPAAAATLTIQLDDGTGHDTWIEDAGPSEDLFPHGDEDMLWLKNEASVSLGILVKFPLSSIPSNATITSATFLLYMNGSGIGDTSNKTIYLKRISEHDWDEATAVESNYPSSANDSYQKTYNVDGHPGDDWINFEVTQLVRDWKNGSINNYGMSLDLDPENPDPNALDFFSSEYSVGAQRPKLIINYTTSDPTPTPMPSPTPTPTPTPRASGTTSSGTTSGGSTGTTSGTTSSGTTGGSTNTGAGSPTGSGTVIPGGSVTPSPTDGTVTPIVNSDGTVTYVTSTGEVTTSPVNALPPGRLATTATKVRSFLTGGQPLSGVSQVAVTTGILSTATIGLPAANAAISLVQTMSSLPSLLATGWSNLLILLGIKKKKFPWGRVLHSVTGEPLPNTLVAIYDRDKYGKLVDQTVTDREGRFGFFVPAGHYSLWAKRVGYSFPSRLIPQSYRGTTFPVGKEGMVILDLFCDPEEVMHTWKQSLRRMVTRLELLRLPLLLVGTVVCCLSLFERVIPLTLFLAIAYLLLWAREVRQHRIGRHTLTFVDKAGEVMAFLVVRFIDTEKNTLTATKVTDSEGEVFALVPGGTYRIEVTEPKTGQVIAKTVRLKQGIPLRPMKIVVAPDEPSPQPPVTQPSSQLIVPSG